MNIYCVNKNDLTIKWHTKFSKGQYYLSNLFYKDLIKCILSLLFHKNDKGRYYILVSLKKITVNYTTLTWNIVLKSSLVLFLYCIIYFVVTTTSVAGLTHDFTLSYLTPCGVHGIINGTED